MTALYKSRYLDIVSDGQEAARSNEARAIGISIDKLKAAKIASLSSREMEEAVSYLQRLWTHFIEALADDDNALPAETRAKLISIGIWMIKESSAITGNSAANFDGLISVSEIIRDSLER